MKASQIRLRGDTDTATKGTRRGNINQRDDNAETQLIYRSNNYGCHNLLFLSLWKWLNLRSLHFCGVSLSSRSNLLHSGKCHVLFGRITCSERCLTVFCETWKRSKRPFHRNWMRNLYTSPSVDTFIPHHNWRPNPDRIVRADDIFKLPKYGRKGGTRNLYGFFSSPFDPVLWSSKKPAKWRPCYTFIIQKMWKKTSERGRWIGRR